VLLDSNIKKTLSLSDLHLGDYSIWEGWEVEGWPVTTILRGKGMVENGQFYGSPTDGRFIPRKIDPLILSRPAC
jgi:dihydropyrimidinase